jgi:hypothetical protein
MDIEAVVMNTQKVPGSSIAEIDYSRDTLFGPIPMQATCRVRLETVEQEGHSLRELTIIGEVPDFLAKASIIRVALEGRIEAGPIVEHYSANTEQEQAFILRFENEHRRSFH